MIRKCETELRPRLGEQRDLWCATHRAWVYQGVGSELLNDEHETVR